MGVVIPGGGFSEDRASGAQIVDGGLRFDSSKTHYLSRTPSIAGNRKTWTWSGWVKRSRIGSTQILFTASDGSSNVYELRFISDNGSSGIVDSLQFTTAPGYGFRSTAVHRDFSAWAHVVVSVDTTLTLAADRAKIYYNGVLLPSDGTANISPNEDTPFNNTWTHSIGSRGFNGTLYFDGYLSSVYFIDGQALDPSYFGYTDPLTNTWRPKKFKPQATPNDGTVWSSFLSGSIAADPYDATKMFDGNLSTFAGHSAINTTITWTRSLTNVTSLRVYIHQGSSTGTVTTTGGSGTQIDTISTDFGPGWHDISLTNTGSTINSIAFARGGSGAFLDIHAVEVNGVTLIDGDTSNIGLNGFHLPFDGSAPIGEDQSGRGNNWTPVNFGGSTSLEKATGALPILNTDGGGKVARVGTRTDENASDIVLALPLVGNKEDVSAIVKGSGSNKTVTSVNAVASYTQSNFYGGSFYFDGSSTIEVSGTLFGGGPWTFECWLNMDDSSEPFLKVGSNTGATFNINNTTFQTDGDGVARLLYTGQNFGVRANEWFHFALVNDGTNPPIPYVNGVAAVGSPDRGTAANTAPAGTLRLGDSRPAGGVLTPYNGYMQDVRYYSFAKYTSNFIPASTDPDIVPDSPSGVSYSSNLTQITDGAVAFDGSGDYLQTTVETLSGDFSIEFWTYPTSSSGSPSLFCLGDGINSDGLLFYQSSGGGLNVFGNNASILTPSGSSLTLNKWQHYALTRSGTDLRLFKDGVQIGTTVTNSTSFNSTLRIGAELYNGSLNATGYLYGFISNFHIVKGTALYTSNFTPPSAPISSVANTKLLCCQSNTSQNIAAVSPNISGVNDGTVWSNYIFKTGTSNLAAVNNPDTNKTRSEAFNGLTGSTNEFISLDGDITFTPPSTITGISQVKVYASGSGTFPNKIYVNGTLQATLTSDTTVTVSTSSLSSVRSERQNTSDSARFSGIEIDGVLLKDPVASAGNAAVTTLNPFTTDINAVRGKQSGYATWDPLGAAYYGQSTLSAGSSVYTISQGNLKVYKSGGNVANLRANFSVKYGDVGKYYFEVEHPSSGYTVIGQGVGWGNSEWYTYTYGTGCTNRIYMINQSLIYSSRNGGNSNTFSTTLTSYYDKILGIAFDLDNNKMYFYVDGILQYTVNNVWGGYFPITDELSPIIDSNGTNNNGTVIANFGQKPFKFPPPAGFQPLALANTPRPTIVRPDQYVGIVTYTGNGGTQSIITEFKPDFVWIKGRSSSTQEHRIFDSVRGAYNYLETNSTERENNGSTPTTGLTNFTSNGFTLLDNTNGNSNVNGAVGGLYSGNAQYVAWAWKAGGNSNTFNIDDVGYDTASAAGLTAGTITPTGASVNTKSGFSIITYTGTGNNTNTATSTTSVGHGLNIKPSFAIFKNRTSTTDWVVYHKSLANNQIIEFTTGAAQGPNYCWNATDPTSSVFYLGNNGQVNNTGNNYVSYCWAEIPGFSKFGSYVSNNSSDGPYVELGFRPALIIFKNIDSSSSWAIMDTERDKYNVSTDALFPNLSNAESTGESVDILSNGFKMRMTASWGNYTSGNRIIYAAFAEAPSINLYGAQANAR